MGGKWDVGDKGDGTLPPVLAGGICGSHLTGAALGSCLGITVPDNRGHLFFLKYH